MVVSSNVSVSMIWASGILSANIFLVSSIVSSMPLSFRNALTIDCIEVVSFCLTGFVRVFLSSNISAALSDLTYFCSVLDIIFSISPSPVSCMVLCCNVIFCPLAVLNRFCSIWACACPSACRIC